jgi:hypothetical protein
MILKNQNIHKINFYIKKYNIFILSTKFYFNFLFSLFNHFKHYSTQINLFHYVFTFRTTFYRREEEEEKEEEKILLGKYTWQSKE